MAWITKNSGTAQIEKRDQPYLTPAMRQDLSNRVLPRYEQKKGALLACLHAVQHEYGWVPHQAMLETAAFLAISPGEVIDCASFYEEYWLRPKGAHLISVCRSIACEFCGQPEITRAIMDRLGIEVGETTDDGKFTLIELECLGACGGGPAVLIDETLHENVKPGDIAALLDGAARGGHH